MVPSSHHESLYRDYLKELEASFPGFRLVKKGQSSVNRVIDRLVRAITFGRQSEYLNSFVTTLGRRVYVPDSWEQLPPGERYCIMRHEAVHLRQFRTYTWLGMFFLYVLLPLPVGWSGRRFIELPAYKETLTARWQLYGAAAAHDVDLREQIVERFTGPAYAWMWLNGGAIRQALDAHLAILTTSPPPELLPS